MSHADPREDALRQRYADLLLEERSDSALTRLVRDLDGVANLPAPDYLQARIGEEVLAAIEQQKAARRVQSAASPAIEITSSGPTRQPKRLLERLSTAATVKRPALRWLIAASIALVALVAIAGGGAFAISRIDPGLAFQLGIPVATGPEYTKLEVTHAVADRTITVSRAAFTKEKAIIGYTYDYPADSAFSGGICVLSLTSDKADSFREFAEDDLGQGANNGVAHGSRVLYFAVERLDSSHQDRHLRLTLHPCEGPGASEAVVFEFALPLQD
jgi:hypothetical protein